MFAAVFNAIFLGGEVLLLFRLLPFPICVYFGHKFSICNICSLWGTTLTDVPVLGMLDARRDRQRPVGRADRAGDPHGPPPLPVRELGGGLAGDLGGGKVDVVRVLFETVVALGDARPAERVRLDYVRASLQVFLQKKIAFLGRVECIQMVVL